jgi:hypothetical protein
MTNLAKCQINMIDLIKPLPFNMAYLTKLWALDEPFFYLTLLIRCTICHVIKKVILIKMTNQKNHVSFMPHLVNLSMQENSLFCFVIMRSTQT